MLPLKTLSLRLILPWLLGGLLLLGIGLRFANLESGIFWVDEVATAVRVRGYTQAEVVAAVADGQPRSPAELWQFVVAPSDRDRRKTLDALVQSPEHAPLYFLLTREWSALFGQTPATLRLLSVMLSLLTLPMLAWLCWEWLYSSLAGGIAAALLAISPLFISYAQEARPYSLWLFLLVLSGGLLMRAWRRGNNGLWIGYGIALTLALYTSLLSLPVVISQGLHVTLAERGSGDIYRKSDRASVKAVWVAIAVSLLAFLPWLIVVGRQWNTLRSNTAWMQLPMGLVDRIGIWLYSLSIPVFDVPVAPLGSLASTLQILTSFVLLLVFVGMLLRLMQQTSWRIWGWILALGLPIPVLLALVDAVFGGRRSTAPRYWIPAHLALVLLIAAFTAWKPSGWLQTRYRPWRLWLVVGLLGLSLVCSLGNLERSPRYLKSRNINNPAIAAAINQSPNPQIFAEPTEVYDLISLSQTLAPTVAIHILEMPGAASPTVQRLQRQPLSCQATTFLFNPSPELAAAMGDRPDWQLQPAYEADRLNAAEISLAVWRIEPDCPSL
ncbi:MAG: glycosyltransferase family 39 protein [Cyanobacteria bacterium J06638_20]